MIRDRDIIHYLQILWNYQNYSASSPLGSLLPKNSLYGSSARMVVSTMQRKSCTSYFQGANVRFGNSKRGMKVKGRMDSHKRNEGLFKFGRCTAVNLDCLLLQFGVGGWVGGSDLLFGVLRVGIEQFLGQT